MGRWACLDWVVSAYAGMAAAAAAGRTPEGAAAAAQDLLAADAATRGADASRRFSRCATHVFIAHFISTQTKLDRQRQQAQQAQHAKQAHQQHLTGGGGGGGKFDLSSLYAARPGVQVGLPSAVKLVRHRDGDPNADYLCQTCVSCTGCHNSRRLPTRSLQQSV